MSYGGADIRVAAEGSYARRIYKKMCKVLPGATVLDMLAAQGYKQVVMFGSERSLPEENSILRDMEIMKEKICSRSAKRSHTSDYRVWWGYEDRQLHDFAKAEVTNLATAVSRLTLPCLTVDTHFEDGYIWRFMGMIIGNQYANVSVTAPADRSWIL